MIKKVKSKYDPIKLFLATYNYDNWFEREESTDKEESVDLSDMHLPKGEEEEGVKERIQLHFLTPNKLLIRLPMLLAQIKTRNNSYKLKTKSKNYYIFCISIIKSLKKFTTIYSSHDNNERKYGCDNRSQKLLFLF